MRRVDMWTPFRCTMFALWGLAVQASEGRAQSDSSRSSAVALEVPVFVTNESFVTRRIQLRVNNVVVLDTLVGEPRDVTGLAVFKSIRLRVGDHNLLLIDNLRKKRYTSRLTVKPGGLCIYIMLTTPRTHFRAGNYTCGLA